jgi:proteasome lid subunit RPN8/RPN11
MDNIFNINSIKLESFDHDHSEKLKISSLSLIKMLRHGKAGIPIEVMGLMLGYIPNRVSIHVQDVFAMPQIGTGVSVEAIDPVFQTKMLDMYEQIGNSDVIVGWYHSHPGFGCWLSGVDINTQQNFEYLNKRAIAVVIDPVQSVRGKIVIEAYKLNSPLTKVQETKDFNSILSMINNPGMFREDHGLNKYYYSLRIGFKKNILEEITLTSIYQKDCLYFLKKELEGKVIRRKIFNILEKIIFSLREISFEESSLYKNSTNKIIEGFKEELKKINLIIRSIIDKILLSCLYDILINYIS